MNPFKNGTPLFPYRWFLVFVTIVTLGMGCSDYMGWQAFNFPASGTGGGARGYSGTYFYHK